MSKIHAGTKGRISIISAGAIGTGIATVLTIIMSVVLTSLILKGIVVDHLTGALVFVIRTIAVFVACVTSGALADGKLLPVVGVSALGYLLILLATGIVAFDGSFSDFGSGILSVITGAMIAVFGKVIKLRSNKHGKIRRK